MLQASCLDASTRSTRHAALFDQRGKPRLPNGTHPQIGRGQGGLKWDEEASEAHLRIVS
jgi:hypothetical protein